MTVDQIAADEVVTAERDASIDRLVDRMAEADVGAVVVTEGDAPVGIVTDRQIALAAGEADGLADATAADVMTENPVTVTGAEGIFETIRTLGDEGIRRVPVVDDDGALQGIVSLDDMVVLLAEELGDLSDAIEKQSPRL